MTVEEFVEYVNTGNCSGAYKVTTSHGTYYEVDFDNGQAIRFPAEGRNKMLSDGEPFSFVRYKIFEGCLYFDMFGHPEYVWRMTTPITKATKLVKHIS